MDPLPTEAAEARCARHPDAPATFVCRRCGAFGCQGCRADPVAGLCSDCVARAQATLGAPVTVGETLSRSLKLPLQHLRATLVYLALALFPELLWALLQDWIAPGPRGTDGLIESFAKSTHDLEAARELLLAFSPRLAAGAVFTFASFLTGVLGGGALVLVFVSSAEGRPTSIGSAYAAASRRFLPLFAANVLTHLAGYLGLALCILPGLAVMAMAVFTDPVVLAGGRGPFEAIPASFRMALKAIGPVAVMLLLVMAVALGSGAPLGMLQSAFHQVPLAQHLLEFARSAVESVLDVPLIAAGAYLYVRVEAGTRLLAETARA